MLRRVDYDKALQAMLNGHKVTRAQWGEMDYPPYLVLEDLYIYQVYPSGRTYLYDPTPADQKAEDYIIY